MKRNKNFAVGMLAVLLAVCFVGCVGKTSPVTDFKWEVWGDGVNIKGYTGKGGAVVIPAEIEGLPVVGIYGREDGPFARNEKITSVVISASLAASLEVIGGNIFASCTGITKAIFPDNLKKIGYSMFYNNISLTTINFPAQLEKIDSNAFAGCGKLVNISIPPGLTKIEIGETAFRGCSSLPLKTRQRLQELGYEGEF